MQLVEAQSIVLYCPLMLSLLHTKGKKSSDQKPLLAKEKPKVEEPEDDLPPPEYRNVLSAVRHMN